MYRRLVKNQPLITTLKPKCRDDRIIFNETNHTYKIDGLPARMSVSAVVKTLFPTFNGAAVVDKYFDIWKLNRNSRYNALIEYFQLQGMTDDGIKLEIQNLWSSSGKVKAQYGTMIHSHIEGYLKYGTHPMETTPEFTAFLEWLETSNLEIVASEKSIFDEETMIAGTIDALFRCKETGNLILIDFKCCKSIDTTNAFGETGLGLCGDLHDSNFNRYSIQQALYKHILEKHYGFVISECRLLQLVGNHSHTWVLPDESERAAAIFDELKIMDM